MTLAKLKGALAEAIHHLRQGQEDYIGGLYRVLVKGLLG